MRESSTETTFEKQPSIDTFTTEDCESDDDEQTRDDQGDMRWRLTAEEKKGVRQLKEAADQEGLYYKNLFEIAKYVLVVRSLEKTKEKRHEVALRRLRKRHAWIKKHQLEEIDEVAAHAEIGDEACPQHFCQHFVRDRMHHRAIVGTHMAYTPLSYINASEENKRKYLAAAMYRMDLGAVDMEEARRGMALATISQGQFSLGRAWKYMRFMKQISPEMKDMHPHTVKAVHAQFPSLVAHLLPAVKHVLPRKVADRIHVYASVEDMGKNLEQSVKSNPGNMELTASEWASQRSVRYRETVAKLSLDS